MNPYKTFETERLQLKPTAEEDAEFIFELFNTPKWIVVLLHLLGHLVKGNIEKSLTW